VEGRWRRSPVSSNRSSNMRYSNMRYGLFYLGTVGAGNTLLARVVSRASPTVPDLDWKESAVLGFGMAGVATLVALALTTVVQGERRKLRLADRRRYRPGRTAPPLPGIGRRGHHRGYVRPPGGGVGPYPRRASHGQPTLSRPSGPTGGRNEVYGGASGKMPTVRPV
jgi:hypothetical protein